MRRSSEDDLVPASKSIGLTCWTAQPEFLTYRAMTHKESTSLEKPRPGCFWEADPQRRRS